MTATVWDGENINTNLKGSAPFEIYRCISPAK